MPRFRKLTEAEVTALESDAAGPRTVTARAYDEHLAGFVVGDYGRVELLDGERRSVVTLLERATPA